MAPSKTSNSKAGSEITDNKVASTMSCRKRSTSKQATTAMLTPAATVRSASVRSTTAAKKTVAALPSTDKTKKKTGGAQKKPTANQSAASESAADQIPRKRKATEDIPIPSIEATEPKSKRAKTSHAARKGKHKKTSLPASELSEEFPPSEFDLEFSNAGPFPVSPDDRVALAVAREAKFKSHIDYYHRKYRYYPATEIKQFLRRRLGSEKLSDAPAMSKKRSAPASLPPRPSKRRHYEYVDAPSAPSGDTGKVDSGNIIEAKRARKSSSKSIAAPKPPRMPRSRKPAREQTTAPIATTEEPGEADDVALPPILSRRPSPYPGEEREPSPEVDEGDADGFGAPSRVTTVRTPDGRECYEYRRDDPVTGEEQVYWILLKGRRPG